MPKVVNMIISVVIPIYNEEKNLELLHSEIKSVLNKNFGSFEIIFVNDCSTDSSLNILRKLKPIKIVTLNKNSGQTTAIAVGIQESTGDFVALLDGDGQNDPTDILNLYKSLIATEADVVCGWRFSRKDSLSKRFISRGAYFLRKKLLKDQIHDSGCTLKVMTREAADSLELRGEIHRFISSILVMKGFKVQECIVNHRPRIYGHSKYNWKRIFKGYLDMLALWFWHRYSKRPIHFFGAASLILAAAGTASLIAATIFILFFSGTFKNILLLNSFASFLFAGQTFLIGLVSEYLARIQISTGNFNQVRLKIESNL